MKRYRENWNWPTNGRKNMKTELKPCPFCGKAVTIADYGSYLCIIAKGTDPKTSCRCRLFMESEQFSADDEEARQRAKENLVEKWNRRSLRSPE